MSDLKLNLNLLKKPEPIKLNRKTRRTIAARKRKKK